MKIYIILFFTALFFYTLIFISKANKEKKEAEARLELKMLLLEKEIWLNQINNEANRIKDSLRNEQRKIYLIR